MVYTSGAALELEYWSKFRSFKFYVSFAISTVIVDIAEYSTDYLM